MKSAVNVSFKWSGFTEYCTSWMSREDNMDFCDVTLVCDEGEKLFAHQIILVNSSSVLRSILNSNRNPSPFIYMRGVKFDNLSSLIDFIYKGETSVVQEDLQQFLDLAENLNIKGLHDQSNPRKNYVSSFHNSNQEKEIKNIDEDLFSIVSKSAKNSFRKEFQESTGNELENTDDEPKSTGDEVESLELLYPAEETIVTTTAFSELEKEHDMPKVRKNESRHPKCMFDTLGNPLFSCSLDVTNVETQSLSLIKIHGKSENPRRGKTYYCIVCQLVSRDKKDCLGHVEDILMASSTLV